MVGLAEPWRDGRVGDGACGRVDGDGPAGAVRPGERRRGLGEDLERVDLVRVDLSRGEDRRRPGGRLAVSDVVATAPFPEEVQHDLALRAGCVAGASFLDDLEGMLKDAGFADIRIQPKDESRTFIREWVPGTNITDYLISATLEAVKP